MNTYHDLKGFADRLIRFTSSSKYSFEIYRYSAKIGYLEKPNQFGYFNAQSKYILTYPKSALDEVLTTFNAFLPEMEVKKGKDNRSTKNRYGVDLYVNVTSIHPYQENAISSMQVNEAILKEHIDRWLVQQEKAFLLNNPNLTKAELAKCQMEVYARWKELVRYLRSLNDPNEMVTVRRSSGIQHKVQIKPNTNGKRVTYSNLLVAVGVDENLPNVVESVKKSRKPRLDSFAEQFKTNPTVFKYYDKFGIFEIIHHN